MRHLALLFAALAITAAAGAGAHAHSRDRVFSIWRLEEGTVTATIRLPARMALSVEGAVRANGGGRLTRHFVRTIMVSLDASPCTAARTARSLNAAAGAVLVDLTWACGTGGKEKKLSVRVDSLFERLPGHLHFARFRLPHGRMGEHVFTGADRLYTVALQPDSPEPERSGAALARDYIGLGVTHILAGADHLAFVLGLMLAASGLRAILFIVTGFTLGHSLTLALAATGGVTPVPAVVEALIGFTVAIVAAEAAGRRPGGGLPPAAAAVPLGILGLAAAVLGSALSPLTWTGLVLFTACYLTLMRNTEEKRWAIALAAAFGLVHGFGFAGVLQEIGLPEGGRVAALLGFNLGVEAGQLAVVAVAFTAGRAAMRLPERARLWAAQTLAAALCGLGTYWFVSRAFAG